MCQNKYFLTTYQLHYSPQQFRSNQFQNISTFINNKFSNMIDWTSGITFTIFQIFPSEVRKIHEYIGKYYRRRDNCNVKHIPLYIGRNATKRVTYAYYRPPWSDVTCLLIEEKRGFWLFIAVLRYNIRKIRFTGYRIST